MDKIQGKIKYKYLRESKFEKARLMAGKETKYEYKYLTQAQIDQLSRYGMFHLVQPLTKTDEKIIASFKPKFTAKDQSKPKFTQKPTIVKYRDEDGIHEAKFDSSDEANKWVDFMESNKSAGEKFEFISMI